MRFSVLCRVGMHTFEVKIRDSDQTLLHCARCGKERPYEGPHDAGGAPRYAPRSRCRREAWRVLIADRYRSPTSRSSEDERRVTHHSRTERQSLER